MAGAALAAHKLYTYTLISSEGALILRLRDLLILVILNLLLKASSIAP